MERGQWQRSDIGVELMYEIVITCLACGTVRSISHEASASLSDAEVLEKAGHTPDCPIKRDGSGAVQREAQRPGEPNVVLYSVVEVQ